MAAKQGRTRETLEGLSKDELVSRAEALGIDGARKFTRVELIDEIARAVGSGDERGLLGRARDLLREVVEKGLARPAQSPTASPESSGNGHAAITDQPSPPVPTVTLAEIYFAQGHVTRARAILREVLRDNTGDSVDQARALLERIERREVPAKPVVEEVVVRAPEGAAEKAEKSALPEDAYARIGIEPEAFAEPAGERGAEVPSMLDDAALPARYDVDECVAMAVDPTTVYVYWEARPKTVDRARNALRRAGAANDQRSTLRVLVVEPSEGGPRVSSRDFEVIDLEYGEWFVRDLPAGSVVRAAVGLLSGDRFLPIAHTVDVEAPAASPSNAVATEVVVWTEAGTRAPATATTPVLRPISRETGTLGLPPLPVFADSDEPLGRGLSSAELARRARVAKTKAAGRETRRPGGASDLLAGPSSASWLGSR